MRSVSITIPVFALLILSLLEPTAVSAGLGSGHSTAFVFPPSWDLEEEIDEEELPPASRQNAILRAYFRGQYVSLRSQRYDLNETFMEKYVDRQIDSFLDDINSRLESLKHWSERAEQAYEVMLGSAGPREEREQRDRLAEILKEVDNRAGGLKGKLLNVFVQLDSKEKLPIAINPKDGYREEIVFLQKQVDEAENQIRDYLFRATNTVPYKHLAGENMMIRLYWAEKTADRIRDQLKR